MTALRVLVVGAGLGGLTLAQALRRHGVDVQVFERDATPWDRPQGYRLHLDADAMNSLREALPPDLHALFTATAMPTRPFTTILGTDLSVRVRIPTDAEHDAGVWPAHEDTAVHTNVDRATLRQILLAGLDDVVHFGMPLTHWESTPSGVVVHFVDGTSVTGDVLVGADGVRSVVRGWRAPGHDTVDAGITAIYGRIPVAAAARYVPDETLQDIFTIASDHRKVFLGLGAVRFPTRPAHAAARFAPAATVPDKDDYVVCIVGGRHEFFPGDSGTLRTATSSELRRIAADAVSGWDGPAADLVSSGDPDAFFLVQMSTSVPFGLDRPTNVTLVGDAVHAMTPTLGRGANLAMRDGALLGRALASAQAGDAVLADALAGYERAMLDYGFRVVREAAAVGEQRMAQNPLPV